MAAPKPNTRPQPLEFHGAAAPRAASDAHAVAAPASPQRPLADEPLSHESRHVTPMPQGELRGYEGVLETTLDAIVGFDQDQRIVLFNRSACSLFECEASQALGTFIDRFVPARYLQRKTWNVDALMALESTPRAPLLVRLQTADGCEFPARISLSRVKMGTGHWIVAALRDARELGAVRSALRDQRKFAQRLVDTADILVLIVDPAGEILQANAFMERVSGFQRRQLEGKNALDLLIPETEREQAREVFHALIRGERPGRHVHQLQTRSGRLRWVQWWDSVLVNHEGALQAVLCVGHDITAQMETEQALKRSQDHAREMEEIASMSTLAAGLAHDIGTPMNIILGYAGMLEESLSEGRDRERARLICQQVERVRHLMHTLMNLSQPGEDSRVPVELGPLLESTLDLLRERLEQNDVACKVALAKPATVLGCPERLERAFLNLLVNAVDAMPRGGQLDVTLSRREEPRELEIAIRDTGVGMPPEVKERIFEPFFSTKASSAGACSGNGLGLMVTRSVILDHGGGIEVESQPGLGTRFLVTFPDLAD